MKHLSQDTVNELIRMDDLKRNAIVIGVMFIRFDLWDRDLGPVQQIIVYETNENQILARYEDGHEEVYDDMEELRAATADLLQG